MQTNPAVDDYFDRTHAWAAEQKRLREIALSCNVTEALKWGKPCYEYAHHNIAIIQPFKACVALMFFKGTLLSDPHGVLKPVGANSRSARRLEFTSLQSIDEAQSMITAYMAEAVEIEQSGAKVDLDAAPEMALPAELQKVFDADERLRSAFVALTPGRQREYKLHIASAKQVKTRRSRVEACIPLILAGRGLREAHLLSVKTAGH